MLNPSLLKPRLRAQPPWGISVPGSLGDAELTEFLRLLGVRREPPSLPFLRRLQRRCLTTVPFENLDIHWRVPIELDMRQAWEKFVRRRRGGFCYELNGLFGWTLEQLGFDVALLSGRVWRKPSRAWGPEYDHLALHVRIGGGDYLVDVGYGDAFRAPLALPAGETKRRERQLPPLPGGRRAAAGARHRPGALEAAVPGVAPAAGDGRVRADVPLAPDQPASRRSPTTPSSPWRGRGAGAR